MKFVKEGLLASVIAGALVGQIAIAQRAPAKQPAPMPAPASTTLVTKDIESTLGFVPHFLQSVSDAQLPSLWQALKTFEMGDTALDGKTKELIGIAVAAQIPCEYCVYFHTEAARKHGASDQQIREAVGMAGLTRMASTVLNGTHVDMAQFKKDTQRIMKGQEGKKPPQAASK